MLHPPNVQDQQSYLPTGCRQDGRRCQLRRCTDGHGCRATVNSLDTERLASSRSVLRLRSDEEAQVQLDPRTVTAVRPGMHRTAQHHMCNCTVLLLAKAWNYCLLVLFPELWRCHRSVDPS